MSEKRGDENEQRQRRCECIPQEEQSRGGSMGEVFYLLVCHRQHSVVEPQELRFAWGKLRSGREQVIGGLCEHLKEELLG